MGGPDMAPQIVQTRGLRPLGLPGQTLGVPRRSPGTPRTRGGPRQARCYAGAVSRVARVLLAALVLGDCAGASRTLDASTPPGPRARSVGVLSYAAAHGL